MRVQRKNYTKKYMKNVKPHKAKISKICTKIQQTLRNIYLHPSLSVFVWPPFPCTVSSQGQCHHQVSSLPEVLLCWLLLQSSAGKSSNIQNISATFSIYKMRQSYLYQRSSMTIEIILNLNTLNNTVD